MSQLEIHRFDSAKAWADFVFSRPVAEEGKDAWHWDLDYWRLSFDTRETLRLAAETFENASESLARFSDDQLGQGLNYLMSNACSTQLIGLNDSAIPSSERIRALRSFVPLFRNAVAPRLEQEIRNKSETTGGILAGVCFLWWDPLPICGHPEDPGYREVDTACLECMQNLLTVPHVAVQESALHGLNEWSVGYPGEVIRIIDEFLAENPTLPKDLREYALGAREGLRL